MKIKKMFLGAMIFIMAFIFCTTSKVSAEQYNGSIWPSEFLSNVYVTMDRQDGFSKSIPAQLIRRSEDNEFVYCIQPYVDVNNNYVYNVTQQDYVSVINLNEEQWQRVTLLAYYGYGYGNHTDKNWWAITQVLIWRTVEPSSQIYFTDTYKGARNDNIFSTEINELEKLVAEHSKTPSFNVPQSMNIGSSLTLTDNNGVLNNFTINYSNNITATKSGNQLTLKANGIGNASVSFTKTSNAYSTSPILYYSDGSQDVFRVGNVDPIRTLFNINILGGKVTIKKLDRDTGKNIPSGEATLKGAVYGVFDETGNKITELTTNEDGTVQSDYLPYVGKFNLRELVNPKGYELDKKEISFELTNDELFPEVVIYEQVVKRNIKIRKFFANGDTGVLIPEENIVFEFYNNKNEMVARVKTDSDGYATLNLPYGTYTGKQITTTSGHEKIDDFKIKINENSPEIIKLSFTNAPIQARLKVIKIDQETKKIITRSGITFKIFDVYNDKYVCQTIAYPKAETLCEFKTDENGILYTPYELTTGKYRLEEVDQALDGYLWNKQSKEFTIDENSKLSKEDELGVIFEVKFENKQVKGKLAINKIGEEFVLEDGYKYEEIPLENVEFEIRANEDIVIGGKKYYSKGELVNIIKSNKKGNATLDNLPLGKYTLTEVKTEENHVLLEEPVEFELEYENQYTEKVVKTIELKNYLKKGTLEFTKTDLVDGTPIPNVEIKIFTEDDELVFTGITDEDGKIVINDLPVNKKMYIIETRAADNYQITDEKVYFEIKENGEVVKASLKNEKIIVEVPDTGLNETYFIEILCILLILIGFGGIISDNKKRK